MINRNQFSLFLLALIALICISSCRENEQLWLVTGNTTMLINGEEWEAGNQASFSPNRGVYGINTTLRNNQGIPIQSYTIWGISPGKDSCIVLTGGGDADPLALFNVYDVDYICEAFKLCGDYENKLWVDSLNEETGYITGRFDFVFIKDFSDCYSGLGDTLRMEDGQFESVVVR